MIFLETEKLYSPLNFHLRDKEDASAGVYDEIDYWRDELTHEEAFGYLDNIEAHLSRDRQGYDNGRGLAEYLRSDALEAKVQSLVPGIELLGDKLWMVADIRLTEPLTQEEMAELKDWWSGQLSDGWGEGIEQREIKVGRGDLYIEPWTPSDDFFIATREEFAHRIGVEELRRLGIEFPSTAEPEQAAPGAGERPLTEQKLYSPVYCEMMETDNGEYGSDYESAPIPQTAAAYYADAIHEAILKERMPGEEERGLMTYYHEADSVNDKVRSMLVDVEVHDDKLWGVAAIKVTEPLTPRELDTLRDYITGQYSDGFGEGFEQREIKVSDGELSVHLWDYDREGGFFIDTEQDFFKRLGLEPPEPQQPEYTASPEASASGLKKISQVELDALKLGVRLDKNLSDYTDAILRLDKPDIVGNAREITAMQDAHFYMTEHHSFDAPELDYFLKFQNPLEVVADAWKRRTEDISDMSFALHEVFDKQDALQGDYALAKDEAPTAVETPSQEAPDTRDELFGRIAKDHCRFETLETRNRDSLDFREVSVWGMKAALEEAYNAGMTHQKAQLKGADPRGADYAVPDKAPADSLRETGAEKRSVLEQIREAAKAPKEPRKDKPPREKSGPEL